jgi:hypothetical protein
VEEKGQIALEVEKKEDEKAQEAPEEAKAVACAM